MASTTSHIIMDFIIDFGEKHSLRWTICSILRRIRVTLYQKKTQKSKIFYVKYFTFVSQTRLIPPLWDNLGHKKKVKYFVSGGKNENIPPKHFIFFLEFHVETFGFRLDFTADSLAQLSSHSITYRWMPPWVLQTRLQELSLQAAPVC